MSEWSGLIGVLVGGVVGVCGGLANTAYSYRRERKDRRHSQIIDALAAWAQAVQRTLWHHANLYRFAPLAKAVPDPEHRPSPVAEYIRIAGKLESAGRRLEALHLRVLLLTRESWIRDEVARLTKRTMTQGPSDKPESNRPEAFDEVANSIREEVSLLLKSVSNAQHLW